MEALEGVIRDIRGEPGLGALRSGRRWLIYRSERLTQDGIPQSFSQRVEIAEEAYNHIGPRMTYTSGLYRTVDRCLISLPQQVAQLITRFPWYRGRPPLNHIAGLTERARQAQMSLANLHTDLRNRLNILLGRLEITEAEVNWQPPSTNGHANGDTDDDDEDIS